MATADIQLTRTRHQDLYEVKNPAKQKNQRLSQVTKLRNAAVREGNTTSVVQRGERIFLVLNDRDGNKDKLNQDARKHLPEQTREGGGLKLSELIAKAK